jgi:hypothetical protein
MYTVGERTQKVDAFAQQPAYVQTVDGRIVPVTLAQPTGVTNQYPSTAFAPVPLAVQPVASAPAVVQRTAAPQTVYRTQPVQERVVVEREPSGRSWKKTAMIIGGSAAGGAGVGGIAGGKKGALIGAAIGGGAASIYEATKRR